MGSHEINGPPHEPTDVSLPSSLTDLSEKKAAQTTAVEVEADGDVDEAAVDHLENELASYGVNEDQYAEVKRLAESYSLEDTRERIVKIIQIHEHDPNFRHDLIEAFKAFVQADAQPLAPSPSPSPSLSLSQIKLEVALITYNSPYPQVRAVVANEDDPSMPSSTVRAWAIGLSFAVLLAFVNQLFSIRQPAIVVGATIAQMLAYPLGTAAARVLPDWGVAVAGSRVSLNPGPFSPKEHMLITIMASVGGAPPFTGLIIWTQYLPQFFNQRYAGRFAYQILIGLGTNFIGYGLAGICRRFLVYPSYCVWPTSLVTIALNTAFHGDPNRRVRHRGPWGWVATASRLRVFCAAFGCMFAYFWLPNVLFQALSVFNWLSWIAPGSVRLNSVVGFNNGLGLNPWPTFDWNILHAGSDPLVLPFFTTLNKFAGSFASLFVILGLWYANAFSAAYLPLNSNRVFDHHGALYNVSRAVDADGLFDAAKYAAYSPAFLSAGNINVYVFSFAIYTATLAYAVLYQWHEIRLGFAAVFDSLVGFVRPRRARARAFSRAAHYEDVHNRLMARYPEVPAWWFAAVLVLATVCGIAGVALWPTHTSPGVVFYGLGLCVVFIVPIGVIRAMTGIDVSLGILAEFIGGALVPGNQLAMNYLKAYGMVTASHALSFTNDLKLAHYVKIPPRQTFSVQMAATLVSTFVCTAVLNFQMNNIPGVCTMDAPNRFTCPWVNSFFTASVLWGTIGPRKIFGPAGQYTLLLLGFPLGLAIALAFWAAKRRFPRHSWLRQAHPVVLLSGAIHWAPFNLSYVWPAVPFAYLSWQHVKRKWPGLWAEYNFVLSSALSSGIAVAGLVIFFAIQWPGIQISWWGNTVSYQGCESKLDPCRLRYLDKDKADYFGPRIGEFH
ncbi:hypothetical protein SPBR_05582 [Sporothrix brasiliensis 5110]|uniref:Oligopeptide transporter 2 n=1 Tax=Sporothrix brasiliensis 5110 TaxID=1398154 RepID=A0A0C2F528_9PEZI|nr:uncharacterized protein SPBR_05582 [Sporothrix brasiliensis 5110]KIH94024.1 hypothetical protein SPBR_05582 [Sporothrix brasiliensis 5110]